MRPRSINHCLTVLPGLLLMSLLSGCSSEEAIVDIDAPLTPWHVDQAHPPITGSTLQVAVGEDFQAALDEAKPGDVIELEAGAVFTGPFVLPRKSSAENPGAPWVLIRSAAPPGSLPPEGVRIDPSFAPYMATLQAASDPIVSAAPGASHYRFEGIRIRPSQSAESLTARLTGWARKAASGTGDGGAGSSDAPFLYNLVSLGTDARRPEDLPHHIIFDRCYIHGDPVVGARRGIALNSRHTAIINSHFEDFKEVGADSQAIAGWNGPGPFTIVNNYLEAAGENIMFGGAVPHIEGLVPADIEIRGNHLFKPLAWRIEDPSYEGTPWSVKNLLELKSAERVLIDGNVLEHAWPHAQNGFAILFTVRNEDGDVPWAAVRDVQFSNNIVRHAANGINILGLDDNRHPSVKTARVIIDNNLFLSVGEYGGRGILFQLLKSTEQLVISRNSADQTGSIIFTDGEGVHESFRFTGNILPHNAYGIIGSGASSGTNTLQRDFPGAEVTGNVFVGGSAAQYPDGNDFPGTLDIQASYMTGVMASQASENDAVTTEGVDTLALCSALGTANPSMINELAFCRKGS